MPIKYSPIPIYLITLFLASFLITPAIAEDTVINVTYSFRALGTGWQEPTFEEGTIEAKIVSSRPLTLLEPDSTFVHLAPNLISRIFHWDETDTVSVIFVDDQNEHILLHLFPEPVYPFDPTGHTVPVISIQTDPENLWDTHSGIYVWGEYNNWNRRGDDWEHPAHFKYWNSEGDLQISRDVGLRINGGYSRSYPQKSFRLYFDHNDQPESVNFDFFGDGPEDFARLICRSGMYPHKAVFDTWATTLFTDLGHQTSRTRFTVLFLNGEYWGVYNLRERLDDEWLEITHGLDKDHFVLIKDGIPENGDPQPWWDFLEWAGSGQDFTSHQFFEEVETNLDLSSYIDWMLVNIFSAPSDNGYEHNLVLMKVEDGPWEYVMWDQEDIFQSENLDSNFFRFFSSDNEADFLEWYPGLFGASNFSQVEPFFLLFNHLMQNAQFRTRFSLRFDELLAGPMNHRNLSERLNGIVSEQLPEMTWHAWQYWGAGTGLYTRKMDATQDWMALRQPLVRQQKTEFMELFMAPVEFSQFSAIQAEGHHVLQWRTESENNCLGYVVQYSDSFTGPYETLVDYTSHPELMAVGAINSPAEYTITLSAENLPDPVFYRVTHITTDGNPVVHNWVEMVGQYPYEPPTLGINELLADNESGITDETGEYEDWIEIHNTGNVSMNLGGLFLTDDPGLPTRWEFPANTVIEPDGFLLVWADSDEEDGPLHASFKLSAAGEYCGLFSSLEDGNLEIDGINFSAQTADMSWGRQCDGCENWVQFQVPSPNSSNNSLSGLPELENVMGALTRVYPNPFNPILNIEFSVKKAGYVEISVFDLAGRRVTRLVGDEFSQGAHGIQWDGRDNRGGVASAGVYYLRAVGQGWVESCKVSLVK